jgi:hypothetical protein
VPKPEVANTDLRGAISCHPGGEPQTPRFKLLLEPMADLEIPNRLLPTLRYFIWFALPFIFFWVRVTKASPGAVQILRSTLGTIVEQPDFKISGRRPGAVQEHAAAPHASAPPYVAASDVGCTVG